MTSLPRDQFESQIESDILYKIDPSEPSNNIQIQLWYKYMKYIRNVAWQQTFEPDDDVIIILKKTQSLNSQ